MSSPLKILFAASEVVPFAKTGGLADVVGSLPQALAARGHVCVVLLPLYRVARLGNTPVSATPMAFSVPIGNRQVPGRLWKAEVPRGAVQVYLVEQPAYFDRDDEAQGNGLYQFKLPGGERVDYPDNCERFLFFSRAVLESVRLLDFWPEVLHIHDWQTGFVPIFLREEYRRRPGYDNIKTLLTIHNLAYQGLFWHWDMLLTGLDWRYFNHRQIEFHGKLNFLKSGIVFADLLNTVSPTYARQILTPEQGCGLEGVLSERREHLFGIVNGVDYAIWNPATDPHIAANYTADSVSSGKAICKSTLQRQLGLPEIPKTLLVGMIARLAAQKGLALVDQIAERMLGTGVQLAVLGQGDASYHRLLEKLKAEYPDQVSLTFSFSPALAHQIEAGADLFLMPSRYEPCGLNQLYSLKYGTIPLVHATGGLADTVVDCTDRTLADRSATGFSFAVDTSESLWAAMEKAMTCYREDPTVWRQLQENGMRQNWSWNRSAAEYESLYRLLK